MLYKETFKVFEGVLDDLALEALLKLASRGIIDRMHGFVKSGKESSVLMGEDKTGKRLAVKVYAIEASNFRRIMPYLQGDVRFTKVRRDKRSVVHAWCLKEYKNLMKARAAGVRCPEPLAALKNVLVMEFLGEGYAPAPRLGEAEIKEPEKTFGEIMADIKSLWRVGLVHGDLSPYNILYWEELPYFIDFSQGVLASHPMAAELLRRDVHNVLKFFRQEGNEEEIFKEVIKNEKRGQGP